MSTLYVYSSPLGDILLACDGAAVTGLWFKGQKNSPISSHTVPMAAAPAHLKLTGEWLDIYFSGKAPDFTPPISLSGTAFQLAVWELLKQIPYGRAVTYGELARELSLLSGKTVSARAVGGAVGRNPVSLIVPCHRVIGAKGKLTGYAGGLERKRRLLELEGIL
ncbi:MAG: methylated-DNA--[protein]-cysteine S-methyltransferase [Clostridiales bacterium]|nr:methylated-DNA--[protein]-cysteine S-methyltransferase [Clostridiales bacterium]